MNHNSKVIVQEAGGTVGGTVEGARGSEIDLRYHDFATVHIDYTGTAGTLYLYPKFRHEASGSAYAWQDFSAAAGDKTATANRLKFTGAASAYVTFDVRGISYMQMYSLFSGTPEGGLGIAVTLEGLE